MRIFFIVLLCFALLFPPAAFAQGPDLMLSGVVRTVAAPFEIPKGILTGIAKPPFPLGIVVGAVTGTAKAIAGIFGGVTDVARGAVPMAKYALPFVL